MKKKYDIIHVKALTLRFLQKIHYDPDSVSREVVGNGPASNSRFYNLIGLLKNSINLGCKIY